MQSFKHTKFKYETESLKPATLTSNPTTSVFITTSIPTLPALVVLCGSNRKARAFQSRPRHICGRICVQMGVRYTPIDMMRNEAKDSAIW